MKVFTRLCMIGVFFLFSGIYAQSVTPINELLDRLSENHMGSIHDVFTPDELQRVRNHLSEINDSNTNTRLSGPTVRLYGGEAINDNFGYVASDLPSTFNIIAPSTAIDFEGAAGVNQSDLIIRGIDNLNNAYNVSKTTGVYVQMGMMNAPSGESWTGIEYNSSNGMWYGLSTDGAGTSHVSVLDFGGMTVTPVGNTGLTLPIALAIDGTGTGYCYDIDNDNAYSINLVTGAPNILGAIGFNANFGQGMAWDSNTDQIFLTALNNALVDTEVRLLNKTTGATTLVGQVEPGTTTQLGYVAIPDNDLLGVEDSDFSNFSFSPNPARDHLNLSATNPIQRVQIFNVLGEQVMNEQLNDVNTQLNVASLQTGAYVMVVTINGMAQIFKVMKE